MPVIFRTALLLLASNIFMTFAWYAHLRNLHERSWYVAALASWGIALFEYLLQVPANRIGYAQLRIPTQIDIHSGCKSAPVPIEIGTCSDANRHTLFRVS
jgi:uncharacterized protein (DUF486 family)